MSNDEAPVPLGISREYDLAEALVGLVDVAIALAQVLCDANIARREDVAACMTKLLEQQNNEGASVPRLYAAAAVRQVFSAKIVGEDIRNKLTVVLTVVAGGRTEAQCCAPIESRDDDPPAAA